MTAASEVGAAEFVDNRLCCAITVVVPAVLDGRLVTIGATWQQPVALAEPHEMGWLETMEVTPEPDPNFWFDPRCDAVVAAFRLTVDRLWPTLQAQITEADRDYWWEITLPCPYDDTDESDAVGA